MQNESIQKVDTAPGTFGPYNLMGGIYQLALSCTGTPAASLQQLMPDGVAKVKLFGRPNTATPGTFIDTLVTEDVITYQDVPPGAFYVVIATSTVNSFTLTRVPQE